MLHWLACAHSRLIHLSANSLVFLFLFFPFFFNAESAESKFSICIAEFSPCSVSFKRGSVWAPRALGVFQTCLHRDIWDSDKFPVRKGARIWPGQLNSLADSSSGKTGVFLRVTLLAPTMEFSHLSPPPYLLLNFSSAPKCIIGFWSFINLFPCSSVYTCLWSSRIRLVTVRANSVWREP